MIPLPKELPELRDRQVRHLRSPYARAFHDDGIDYVAPFSIGRNAGREADTWERAALFHIAPSMVDLVMQAKDGIGDSGFAAHDLPTPAGVAVFGAPLSSKRITPPLHEFTDAEYRLLSEHDPEFDEAAMTKMRRFIDSEWQELLAVSWSDEPPTEEHPLGCVRMTWWHEKHSFVAANRAKRDMLGKGADDVDQLERLLGYLGEYANEGATVIGYGPDAATVEITHDDRARTSEIRADMFRALCFLLRQRVAQETIVGPDRAARRRMAREGREPAPVRLISIRGASASGGGDGTRDYVHRWIVRGHWRRQWYRSIRSHRPVWITPYVKGPEDAPMIGGQKVYTASAPSESVSAGVSGDTP